MKKELTSETSRVIIQLSEIYSLFLGNKFTSPKQSSFKPGYSRINQLLWISLEIYKQCDDRLEVRSVSWTCLRLWIKFGTRELIFQLERKLCFWWTITHHICFFKLQETKGLLNGQILSWNNVQAGGFNVYTNFFNLYKRFIWGFVL